MKPFLAYNFLTGSGDENHVFQFVIERRGGVWSFDDPNKQVVGEPFVCGINEMIDDVVEHFGNDRLCCGDNEMRAVDGQKVVATFCDKKTVVQIEKVDWGIDNKQIRQLIKINEKEYGNALAPNYTPYRDPFTGKTGAFCPVFLRYFPSGKEPEILLLMADPVRTLPAECNN